MTTLQQPNSSSNAATFSIPSILALICAVASFAVGSVGGQLLLSIGAALLGVLGVVLSILPGVRGGLLSVASVIVGSIGVIVGVIRLIASIG